MNKKELILKYGTVLSFFYRLLKWNKIKIKGVGNLIKWTGAFAGNNKIKIIGNNNSIVFEPGLTRVNHCSIFISGNNCKIKVGRDSNVNRTSFYIENGGGAIVLDKHVTITGNTDFAVIEGKTIHIGEDCLFSNQIEFRVGDSHSILDATSRKRINPSMDINVGKHVWIGHDVKVLKGANVGDNSIVATGAIVTKNDYPSNVIIGGVGRILKENIDWCPQRIYVV